jgi:hypothetical protein
MIASKDFQTFVNECPVLFLTTLQFKSKLYAIPDLNFFNPRDCKSGDFFIEKTESLVEAKCFAVLEPRHCVHIEEKYSQNITNSSLLLSVYYNKLIIEEKMFLDKALSIGFRANNVFFYSKENLRAKLAESSNFTEFYNYYNVPWSAYADSKFVCLERTLLCIIIGSKQIEDVKVAQRFLIDIKREREEFKKKTPFSKPPRVLIYNNDNQTEEGLVNEDTFDDPEDILSDVSNWFD